MPRAQELLEPGPVDARVRRDCARSHRLTIEKGRRFRTGPDLHLRLVAGGGFEPPTFGL